MTNCILNMEGQGFKNHTIHLGTIASDESYSLDIDLMPTKSGQKTLLVDLDCTQIQDIKVFYTVPVEESDAEKMSLPKLKPRNPF